MSSTLRILNGVPVYLPLGSTTKLYTVNGITYYENVLSGTFKLYYYNGTETIAINLYNSVEEIGSPTHYMVITVDGVGYKYIPLSSNLTHLLDSGLRVRDNDTTYAVLYQN